MDTARERLRRANALLMENEYIIAPELHALLDKAQAAAHTRRRFRKLMRQFDKLRLQHDKNSLDISDLLHGAQLDVLQRLYGLFPGDEEAA